MGAAKQRADALAAVILAALLGASLAAPIQTIVAPLLPENRPGSPGRLAFTIGSPPVSLLGTADTGSGIINMVCQSPLCLVSYLGVLNPIWALAGLVAAQAG
jgi:hypothetical protein